MKMGIILLLGLLVPALCAEEGYGASSSGSTNMSEKLAQAIDTAKQELKRRNYPHADKPLTIKADETNSVWNTRLARLPQMKESPTIKAMQLDQHPYWAIYVAPQSSANKVIKGGDGFVFIERSNGRVLGVLLGK